MPIIVDISIHRKEEVIAGDVGRLDLSIGDKVIVDYDQTSEIGMVLTKERMEDKPKKPVYRVIRKVTQDDIPRTKENQRKNTEVTKVIAQKVKDHELILKLTCVEYSFDRSKLYIYYTADTRIDFRNLIKDLGHSLKTRIQMVQIGVRDEARMLGGYGPCGRPLCCKTFINAFSSVTIEMAKIQDPSLNVMKMSGVCGRLMCCLAYENAFYTEQAKKMPRMGNKVNTPDGIGKVTSLNYLKEEVTVSLEDGNVKRYPVSKISGSFFSKIKDKMK